SLARRRERRRDCPEALRGRRRAGRATVPRRLRVLRRARARQARELAIAGRGEPAPRAGATGAFGTRTEPRASRAAEVHRQPALPERLQTGEHADHFLGDRVRATGRDRGRLRRRHQAGRADRHARRPRRTCDLRDRQQCAGHAADGREQRRACARSEDRRERARSSRPGGRLASARLRPQGGERAGGRRDRHRGDAVEAVSIPLPWRHSDRGRDERRPERHGALQTDPDRPVRGLRLARRRYRPDHAQADSEGTLMPADAAKAAGLLFLVVVVQLSVMANVDILGGHPNLLLVTVVCVSLLRGAVFGAVAGFSAGLLADTGVFGTLGFTALLLTLAGYWTGRYGETTGRDRAHAPLLSIAVITILYQVAALVLRYMLGEPAPAGDI